MADLARLSEGWRLADLATALGGTPEGPLDFLVRRAAQADSPDPEGICFAESEVYLAEARLSAVGAILAAPGADTGGKPTIRVAAPRLAFFRVLHLATEPLELAADIHPAAQISADAEIASSAWIGAFAVIGARTRIGENVRIHPGCYVGPDCELGDGVVLMPNVSLVAPVEIGAGTLVHSGAILGADGFGFSWDGERRVKIPQVGGVRIGRDCEIGAGTCVDRAMAGWTEIGDGSKLDNLVQVGHNVRIGRHAVIAAHVGIAGSVRIGDRFTCGGQVAIREHAIIGDDVVLAGRTGVMQGHLASGEYFGTPATPIREAMRQLALIRKLPEFADRLRALEKVLSEVEGAK